MSRAIIGLCVIDLHLPGVGSLKQKRRILKSMLTRLHNNFNISAAETDYHDKWQSAQIAVASVSNSGKHSNQIVSNVLIWIETNYPDALIVKHTLEIL
jgi:uncharacterized protein